MKESYKKSLPILIVFSVVNLLVFIFQSFLQDLGFGILFLVIANLLLFGVSFIGFVFQVKGLKSGKINALLRGVFASLLVKMFVVIIGLAIYLFVTKGKINKPSLFTSMVLYIVYTFIEVKLLLNISRSNPHA
jgi:hypothetical protein